MDSNDPVADVFKKPDILQGKGEVSTAPKQPPKVDNVDAPISEQNKSTLNNSSDVKVPYEEPAWSGIPADHKKYTLEVLKNGSIIENINLGEKPFWVFGRLTNCDVIMQHPSISRHHAILQYREKSENGNAQGFYIYDLGSTHGTFLNKNKLIPKIFVKVHVGHMVKLGGSTRTYILNGPDDDIEEESDLTVTELKQERLKKLQRREEEKDEMINKQKTEAEEMARKREERGIDWGLGEDAEEETDLSENPFAQTNNEDLYINDPKKTLRGFFEREGLDLEYNCSEQGLGQFLCKVELPMDDDLGRPIVAEVIHKGKKKEAVIQCALEACRILDRYGMLRQATHESHKRKPKNWEDDDFYDSDDDIFLDRTGTIEKKRLMRMNKIKPTQTVETYDSLSAKEKSLAEEINKLESELSKTQSKMDDNESGSSEADVDPLDLFMQDLKDSKPTKQVVSKQKFELVRLKQEHEKVVKLLNISKPANLPALIPPAECSSSSGQPASKAKQLPLFGKRKKIKLLVPSNSEKPSATETAASDEPEQEEENDVQEQQQDPVTVPTSSTSEEQEEEATTSRTSARVSRNNENPDKMTIETFEKILEKIKLPPLDGKSRDKLEVILRNLKKMAREGDRMHVEWKTLEAKKRKILKLVSNIENSEPDERLEFRIASEMNKILSELNTMSEQKWKVIDKIKKMGNELNKISDEIESRAKTERKTNENRAGTSSGDTAKGDVESTSTESMDFENGDNYSMWTPPVNQTGDGKTHLNEKFGY